MFYDGNVTTIRRPMKFDRPFAAVAVALAVWTTGAVAQPDHVSIARESVTMRAGPGTHHAAQWTLSEGYPLRVTGASGKWLKVQDFENDTGWVYQPLTGATRHHIVKASVANLRSGPGAHHKLIAKLARGEVVRTVTTQSKWVQVRTDAGVQGWVARSLVWGW
jgi:SH3-like domain-containing protein